MTVGELLEKLKGLPPETFVEIEYEDDGALDSSEIATVYLQPGESGAVVLSMFGPLSRAALGGRVL